MLFLRRYIDMYFITNNRIPTNVFISSLLKEMFIDSCLRGALCDPYTEDHLFYHPKGSVKINFVKDQNEEFILLGNEDEYKKYCYNVINETFLEVGNYVRY